jgi:hypothetical protein
MQLTTRFTAITLIFAFLSVAILGSGCITLGASAEEIDPFEIKAAPHFRDVTYVTDEPSYLQRFDGLGRWKVSVGAPSVSVSNSALSVSAPSATPVELTLSGSDAPGINPDGRCFIETRLKASNVSTQNTSFTVENVATGNIAGVTIASGSMTYQYTTASNVATGNIYAPIAANTYYRVAIELTATTLTYYVHAADGTLLANYYANSAVLNAGEINEVHFGIEGAAGSATFDYLYVTDTAPLTSSSDSIKAVDAMTSDAYRTQAGIRLDRQSLDLARSGSEVVQAANGIPALDLTKDRYTKEELIDLFGAMPEPNQRIEGILVAKGWTDFRGDLESSLRSSIAGGLGLQASNVFLVDYYVDYLQLSTEVDEEIVETQYTRLWESLRNAYAATNAGETKDGGSTTQLSVMSVDSARSTMTMTFLPAAELDLIGDMLADVGGTIAGGAKAAELGVRWACEQAFGFLDDPLNLDKFREYVPTWKDIQDGLNQTYNQVADRFTEETARWWAVLNATTEKFIGLVGSSMTAAYTWATGTVNNITASVTDSITSIAEMNKEFMSWSQTQMENTNAMFAQMFSDMSDNLMETQRFFADQQAKANQAITNITSELANSRQVIDNMWADFLAGGKPADGSPLTMSAFFGDELVKSIVVVVVVAAIIVIIALVLVMFSGRKKAGRRRT